MELMNMYDENFNQYLQLAKVFIKQLKSRDDREVCMNWIKKLLALKTQDPTLKKNRNEYLKYMLTLLQRGSLELLDDYPQYDDMYKGQVFEKKSTASGEFQFKWSPDRRLYAAAKPVPGRGMLVYLASTDSPHFGWDYPGRRKA